MSSQADQRPSAGEESFPPLPDLLRTSSTLAVIETADERLVDRLLSFLPPILLVLAQEADDLSFVDATPGTAQAAMEALSLGQKKDILAKVLRSPQFSQSLASLTIALRDGGLPSVSEALGIKVANGGYGRGGGMPLGGAAAVAAFVTGVRKTVEEEKETSEQQGGEQMEAD